MPPTDEEEAAHRAQLGREYRRRLRVLELRAARQGEGTDPAVLTEIEELRAKVSDLNLVLAPKPAPEIKEAIRRHFDDDLDFLIASFRGINERLTRGEERDAALDTRVKHVEQQQHAAAEWREETSKAMGQERHERVQGQQRNFRLLIAAVVLGAVVLALLLFVLR